MKIAAAAYPIDWHKDWKSYEAKLTHWVRGAAEVGAELLVFPEYGAMELASLAGARAVGDIEATMRAVDARRLEMNELHARLAQAHGVHILGASAPAYDDKRPEARPTNRAVFFTPDGEMQPHDKQILTRFEREEMDMRPGAKPVVMNTKLGKIGVLICYDSEFPVLARSLVTAGAEILLVPSATEALSGYCRVQIGAMARALENQCIVVHAPTQGAASWNRVVDHNMGRAGVYAPPDKGFPDTGIIEMGDFETPGWTFADVSLDRVAEVRRDGHVLNHVHWGEQADRAQTVTEVDFLADSA